MAYDGSLKFDTKVDSSGFQKGLSGLGNIAKKSLQGVAVAAGTVGAAITKIGYDAIKSYSNYEQLVGGVETLFKNSADTVVKNAGNAFKTAGLSANQYMETVTSFSASLLQSLGGNTAAAAQKADMAITDMSDNANKMGTSMEMIQNAYQGFAKQNYTMLDNLKLGYGGTKEEMQRLLDHASKMPEAMGKKFDISNYADVVDAIHLVQNEMGITGTTAQEASTTIQGSLSMLKGSWENLMTGLTDPTQNLSTLMDDVFNSFITVSQNLMPRIGEVLGGVTKVFDTLAPLLIQTISELIPQLLPSIISGVSTLIDTLITFLSTNTAAITQGAVDLVMTFVNGITTTLPQFVGLAATIINSLVNGISSNAGVIVQGAVDVVMTLVDAILAELPMILQLGLDLIVYLAEALADALPELIPVAVETILTLVDTLLNNIDKIIDAALDLILALADGLIEALPILIDKAPEIIAKLCAALIRALPKIYEAGGELIGKLIAGIGACLPKLWTAMCEITQTIWDTLYKYFTQTIPQCGEHLITGIWQGIVSKKDWLVNQLKDWAGGCVDKIKDFFKIKSPSRVMRDEVGKYLAEGVAVGIEENTKSVTEAFKKMLDMLDTQKDFGVISDAEYYNQLEQLRDKYLKKGTKEWYEYTKKILDYQDKQEEERTKATEKARDDEFSSLKKQLDYNIITEEQYYYKLGVLRDKYFAEDSDKWQEYSHDIAEYQSKLIDNYANTITSMLNTTKSKLSSYGDLFTTITTTYTGAGENGTDFVITRQELNDLSAQTDQLREYADTLQAVKNRGELPTGFFDELKGMSLEDGLAFAKALLSAEDEEFSAYLQSYQDKQDEIARISTELNKDEITDTTNKMMTKLREVYGDVPDDFLTCGADSADEFANGFIAKLPEIFEEIRSAFANYAYTMIPTAAIAGAASGGNSYSSSYNFYGSGQTVSQQLQEARNADTVNRLRGDD